MKGGVIVSHVMLIDPDTHWIGDWLRTAKNEAVMDWQNYARLRGFVPASKPLVTFDYSKCDGSENSSHTIRVEGWCVLHSGPGIPPLEPSITYVELDPVS